MITLANATAAGTSVVIGDTRFVVGPLRDREWGELERWVQMRHITSKLDLMRCSGMTEEEIAKGRMELVGEAEAITVTSLAFERVLQTPEGAMRYAWLTLWRMHGDLSEDDGMALLADPETLTAVVTYADALNAGGNGKAASKKKRTRRKKTVR